MRNIIFVACLLLFSGCTVTRDVESKYRPIETMAERLSLPDGDNWITTVGKTVYVGNLEKWMADHPEGSPHYDSIMQHEKVHSHRQLKAGLTGLTLWLANYLSDQSFRWKEEQFGWYVQLKMYQRYGLSVDPEGAARFLASYIPKLVDYDEALQWVHDVLSGNWEPQDGELPPSLEHLISD